jgi:hypothetical protein
MPRHEPRSASLSTSSCASGEKTNSGHSGSGRTEAHRDRPRGRAKGSHLDEDVFGLDIAVEDAVSGHVSESPKKKKLSHNPKKNVGIPSPVHVVQGLEQLIHKVLHQRLW